MTKLKPFDYKKFTKSWDGGAAGENLVDRAQTMANMILYELNIGLDIDDFPDIDWYDNLWFIYNDDELFESIQNIVTELVDQSGGSAKERNQFIKEILDYSWDDGEIIK